jgi:hypothetical protein
VEVSPSLFLLVILGLSLGLMHISRLFFFFLGSRVSWHGVLVTRTLASILSMADAMSLRSRLWISREPVHSPHLSMCSHYGFLRRCVLSCFSLMCERFMATVSVKLWE